jgi:hypothetical protein
MRKTACQLLLASGLLVTGGRAATLPAYYAHDTVQDAHGVIAPWYQGLNGQLNERLNIAVNGANVIEGLNVRNEVGTFKAYVREFPGVVPQNSIVELRFTSTPGHDAMIQAAELIPAASAQ